MLGAHYSIQTKKWILQMRTTSFYSMPTLTETKLAKYQIKCRIPIYPKYLVIMQGHCSKFPNDQ